MGGGGDEVGVTVPDIMAYTRDTHSFAALGGYQGAGFELSGTGDPGTGKCFARHRGHLLRARCRSAARPRIHRR